MHHGSSAPFSSSVLPAWLALALLAGAGCSSVEHEGHYWSITAKGVEDRCTGGPATAKESFEYRVRYTGTSIEVAVGSDVFATGTANGCQLAYESLVWTEERNGYEVSWRIVGHAVAQQEGTSCNIANGKDWEGTELFEVVRSDDPELAPGCAYEMALEGTYLEEVK